MADKNIRRCVSCHRIAAKDAFWRVVRTFPDHHVQLDKGMGRSAYLCPQRSCLNAAQKKKRLARVLKAHVPPDIYQILAQRLTVKDSKNPIHPSP
ncbi:MAG: YlxR family protein [Phormidesmis sp. RL_2_1]|nr:YlxR family protein [Phormidesmis sp. RL_2_1]